MSALLGARRWGADRPMLAREKMRYCRRAGFKAVPRLDGGFAVGRSDGAALSKKPPSRASRLRASRDAALPLIIIATYQAARKVDDNANYSHDGSAKSPRAESLALAAAPGVMLL